MIVSVPFAFQVRSLQGLVKLETELARRTPRKLSSLNQKSFLLAQGEIIWIQMLALVQRFLDLCQPARSYFLKRQRPAPYSFSYRRSTTFCNIDNEARRLLAVRLFS